MRILVLLLFPLFSYSQLSIGILESVQKATDADAKAFITAAAITNATEIFAINNLVIGLKRDSLWNKMKAIYPFVGGSASSNKYNLKSPFDADTSFRLLFFGGWTHSFTGAKPNGTSGYARTYFIPSVQQSLNSNGLGAYFTEFTTAGVDPVQIGSFESVTQSSVLVATSTSLTTRLNGSTISGGITGGGGSFDAQRTSSTVTTVYKNGSSVATGNSGGTLPTIENYLGTLNFTGTPYSFAYNNSEFRFAYFSEGLNSTEIANLRTIVQKYQTNLGRQL